MGRRTNNNTEDDEDYCLYEDIDQHISWHADWKLPSKEDGEVAEFVAKKSDNFLYLTRAGFLYAKQHSFHKGSLTYLDEYYLKTETRDILSGLFGPEFLKYADAHGYARTFLTDTHIYYENSYGEGIYSKKELGAVTTIGFAETKKYCEKNTDVPPISYYEEKYLKRPHPSADDIAEAEKLAKASKGKLVLTEYGNLRTSPDIKESDPGLPLPFIRAHHAVYDYPMILIIPKNEDIGNYFATPDWCFDGRYLGPGIKIVGTCGFARLAAKYWSRALPKPKEKAKEPEKKPEKKPARKLKGERRDPFAGS